ncbi:EamA family transporter [Kiloniella antarctica]|uniref:EamA family transporter n=1 Tax=Kiloniella antarctica TaxID=1550907 RepID=A0ABW5BP78_9PROT
MPFLALIAALGAALVWAAAALIAHFPARELGAFSFTRIQLIASSLLLGTIVCFAGSWGTVAWNYWPELTVNILISVILGNLFMVACLRRGGPRRMQLLFALNAPIAGILGYIFLDETLSFQMFSGCLLALFGVVLAILYGGQSKESSIEQGQERSNKIGFENFETVQGPFAWVIIFGLLSASCQAIGLIAIKPVMLAGTDPMAASFIRTGGAAIVFLIISPLLMFKGKDTPQVKMSSKLLVWTILPGFMGYVCAVSMLLYALNNYETGVVAVLGSTAPVMLLPMIWWKTKKCPLLPAWGGAVLTIIGSGLIANG